MQLLRKAKPITPNAEDAAWLCSPESEKDEKKVNQILAAWAKAVETDEGRTSVLKFGLRALAYQALRGESFLLAVSPILPWLGIPEIMTGLGAEYLRTSEKIVDGKLRESFVALFAQFVEACAEEDDDVSLQEGSTLADAQKRLQQQEQYAIQVKGSISDRKMALQAMSTHAVRSRRRSIEHGELAVVEKAAAARDSEEAQTKFTESSALHTLEATTLERRVEELEEKKRQLRKGIDDVGVALDAAVAEQRRAMALQDELRRKLRDAQEQVLSEKRDNNVSSAVAYGEATFVTRLVAEMGAIPREWSTEEEVPPLNAYPDEAESAQSEFQSAVEDHAEFCAKWHDKCSAEAETSRSRAEVLGTTQDAGIEERLKQADEALKQARASVHHFVDSGMCSKENDNNVDSDVLRPRSMQSNAPLQIDPNCMKLDDSTPIGTPTNF